MKKKKELPQLKKEIIDPNNQKDRVTMSTKRDIERATWPSSSFTFINSTLSCSV